MAGKKGAIRLPPMTSDQMRAVDELVISVMRAPVCRTRGLILERAILKLRVMDLPHRQYPRIVSQSLQRLRAAGTIYTAGGGNAIWMLREAA
jgi:hypothetical protein